MCGIQFVERLLLLNTVLALTTHLFDASSGNLYINTVL